MSQDTIYDLQKIVSSNPEVTMMTCRAMCHLAATFWTFVISTIEIHKLLDYTEKVEQA